jgi:hypothetical protein
MKKLSIIILGTIAVLLIGLAAWQLKWMSNVVDNYDATKSYKGLKQEVKTKDDKLNENSSDADTAYQTAADDTDTLANAPVTATDSNNEEMVKEGKKADVPDQPAGLESKEVKVIPVKSSEAVKENRENIIIDADSKKSAPSQNEKITIKEDTISIKLRSDKPLPPLRKQGNTRTPISPGKPLNIPAPSVTPHATSTSPY